MKQSLFSKYDVLQKLRLYSGIALMVYAFTHLLNHSVGIFDVTKMEQGRLIFLGFWRHPLLSWVVPASILVHLGTVIHKLFWRNTFKGLSRNEWVQIILGLMIPVILLPHIIETYICNLFFEIDDNYSFYLSTYYPAYLIEWFFAILIIWSHGVLGMKLYLQQKRWFVQWKEVLRGVAIGLPIFAFLGIVSAGKEIMRLRQDPEWLERVIERSNPTGFDWSGYVDYYTILSTLGYLALLGIIFGGRYIRIKGREREKNIEIKYLNGRKVAVREGTSLLEASLKAQIPHAHACGGRGRCSTCRVHVIEGLENISPPGDDELELLRTVNVGKDVRLACKSFVKGDCTIYPLLAATVNSNFTNHLHPERKGVDKKIAILFSDLRGFTSMTENKLPYDVVHVLNQYYQFMGQAIEANGGKVDKFIGDGIMALFGLESDLKTGCAQALEAAKAMSLQLVRLNESLKSELKDPLKMGMGIHCGSVIVGEMGYRNVSSLTAIGDVVNTTSRLEGESKAFGCELVVSDDVAQQAGADLSAFPNHQLQVRGRKQPLLVYCLERASDWGE